MKVKEFDKCYNIVKEAYVQDVWDGDPFIDSRSIFTTTLNRCVTALTGIRRGYFTMTEEDKALLSRY